MRKSIDELLIGKSVKSAKNSLERLSGEEVNFLRGGDRPYFPIEGKEKSENFWQKASVLLDSLK